MSLVDRKNEVINKLQYFDNWEDRYKQILSYSKKLAAFPEDCKNDVYLVRGCISKVWLKCEDRDGILYFLADSEAQITKGIIGLLVYVYSGEKAQVILDNPPTFLKEVGIFEHLTMNRRNGLANMVALIEQYAKSKI